MATQIKALAPHSKVDRNPNELVVVPIFQDEFPDNIWSNTEIPIFVFPAIDGKPVFSSITTPPYLGIGSEFTLSSTPITYIEDCVEKETGCYLSIITFPLSGTTTTYIDNGCECPIEITEPVSSIVDLDLWINTNLGIFNKVIPDITVTALEKPYEAILVGYNKTFKDLLDPFDFEDGNGIPYMFGNPNSETSKVLSSIFSSDFTKDFRERVTNFKINTSDIDLVDLEELSRISTMLGCEEIDIIKNLPSEISRLVKIGSITYEDLFGSPDNFEEYAENIGELLDPTEDFVSAGEILFTQPVKDQNAPYSVLHVPLLHGLSSFGEDTTITGDDVYPLSSLNIDGVVNSETCFFRGLEIEGKQRQGYLDLDKFKEIPSLSSWEGILCDLLEYDLIKNISK